MNAKQRRFVDSYMETGNATQAAREAGYSAKSAESQGSKLLKDSNVSQEIARREAERRAKAQARAEEYEVNRDWVVAGLRRNAVMAFATEDFSASNKAFELLGKEIGMFKDRKVIEQEMTPEQARDLVAKMLIEAKAERARRKERAG